MSSAAAADVIVVGGGVMGSATAWSLARRGVDVLLLERFERGHVRGSSHGGSRIFRLAYADGEYVRLGQRARDLWLELEDEAECHGEILQVTGGLDHGDPDEVDRIHQALVAARVPRERLTPEEAGERWPQFRFDRAVVHTFQSGRLLADRAVRTLQDRAAESGARLRFECRMLAIEANHRSVMTFEGEILHASRAIVVTAGAWVGDLVTPLGIPLPPLRVTREQVFHFPVASGQPAEEEWPSFIHYEARSHYGLCTPGEGIKVAEHGTGPETTGDSRTFEIDEIGRRRVVNYVRDWIPGLVPEPATATTCLYTNTPDSSFVLDRHGNVVVGSACSGHGFKFAPAIGERLADLAVP
ncbi:MAG TPA: N-methyl-L-tryptophan oxidase [Acidimicrobiales bacterium]|nr:N-methyl-L-tryptophan oxidase [Acidimicrobiales bacterium]